MVGMRRAAAPAQALGALAGLVVLGGRGVSGGVACSSFNQLLWSITPSNGTNHAYLIASYPLPAASVEPLPNSITEVLSCTDEAFFQLPCSLSAGGGFGTYLSHCTTYPASDTQDTVSARLSASELQRLIVAFEKVSRSVPLSCPKAKDRMLEIVSRLREENFTTTLQTMYADAMQAIDPLSCSLIGVAEQQGASLEDMLRQSLASKPIWGLEDVSVECDLYESNTVAQDQELASRLVDRLSNDTWLQQASATQGAMAEVLKCGDLSLLEGIRDGSIQLPRLNPSAVLSRSRILEQGIADQLRNNPGKTLLFVVNVQHLLETTDPATGKDGSVLGMLAASGHTVQQITGPLDCRTSTVRAPGAKELDQCFRPFEQEQPATCQSFRSEFKQLISNKTMYNQEKNTDVCAWCVNSPEPCTCDLEWNNTEHFEALCNTLEVDGVRGQVYWLDLTRNPNSHRSGDTATAAKTVHKAAIYCFATTCNIKLAEEVGLRKWYSREGQLTDGKATFRLKGTLPEDLTKPLEVPNPFGGHWNWFNWALALLVAMLLIALLVGCFKVERRKKASKSWRRRQAAGHSSGSGDDSSEESDETAESTYEQLMPLAQQFTPQGGNISYRTQPQDQMWQQQPQLQQERSMLQMQDLGQAQLEQQRQQQQLEAERQQLEQRRLQVQQQQQELQQRQQLEQQQLQQQQQFWQTSQQASQMTPGRPEDGMYDTGLLQQAMEMQRQLGDAGAQAVQQMQSMQHVGSMGLGSGIPFGAQAPLSPAGGYGSPIGSGLLAGMPMSQPLYGQQVQYGGQMPPSPTWGQQPPQGYR